MKYLERSPVCEYAESIFITDERLDAFDKHGSNEPDREILSQLFWRRLDETQKMAIKRTVQSELERLAATVDSWIPLALNPQEEGWTKLLDVVIRISPNAVGPPTSLSKAEKDEVDKVIQGLTEILEED